VQSIDPKTGDRFLVLRNGYRYQGLPGRADYVITHYAAQGVRLKDNQIGVKQTPKEARSSLDLFDAYDSKSAAELQWRLSMPVSLVVLGVLGAVLARTTPRKGRFGQLFNAVLFYVVYSNFMGIVRELVSDGEIPSTLGIWPVHGAVLLFATALYFYQGRLQWWIAAARSRRMADTA
jgi:lipopolysaccharide export system permease protein